MINLNSNDIPKIKELLDESGRIPPHTCPAIDKVIKSINSIEHIVLTHERMYDTVSGIAGDIGNELYGMEDSMEELRKDNEKLRDLGIFWYKHFSNLVNLLEEHCED